MSECDLVYNEKKDTLCLVCKNKGTIANFIEGKYGIEVGININEIPICFTIPEPEILFGINLDLIKEMTR